MRLVVDSNVFVSATLKRSSWSAMVVRWAEEYGVLLKTTITEQDILQVLVRPRLAPKVEPGFLDNLRKMLAAAEPVTIIEQAAACRDPKDDKFLELAVNGRADVIIAGDADLLVLDSFRGIPIVTPAAFARAQVP